MYKFGSTSSRRLGECHEDIQKVFNEVIKIIDCSVLEGHRDKETQDHYFATGRSKVRFPNGKHNATPSDAIDAAPYPINWDDKERFYYFAGIVLGIAASLGVKLRWGGDWDRDNDLDDQTFDDLVHFERIT